MQYHIFFIATITIIILLHIVPLIIYLSCCRKDVKKKSRGLASFLTVIFTIIAVAPVVIFGGIWLRFEVNNDKEYKEALACKERLVQLVNEKSKDFHTIAEYEASFEYPDCIFFEWGHDTAHLKNELGVTVDPLIPCRLTINSATNKVDEVLWDYYVNDYYNVIIVYPVGDYDIPEYYEHICGNIYIYIALKDHE